jgi:hypothetical protein
MTPPAPSDVRAAVAIQPTVEQGIVALLHAWCSHTYAAIESGIPTALKALADDMSADVKSWSDAVFANTAWAVHSATTLAPVPVHVASVFAIPAVVHPMDAGMSNADVAKARAQDPLLGQRTGDANVPSQPQTADGFRPIVKTEAEMRADDDAFEAEVAAERKRLAAEATEKQRAAEAIRNGSLLAVGDHSTDV